MSRSAGVPSSVISPLLCHFEERSDEKSRSQYVMLSAFETSPLFSSLSFRPTPVISRSEATRNLVVFKGEILRHVRPPRIGGRTAQDDVGGGAPPLSLGAPLRGSCRGEAETEGVAFLSSRSPGVPVSVISRSAK